MSARAGSGIVIAKTQDGFWSAPAAIGIGGLGGGFNVGAEVTDFLIVLNSRSAVRSFMATGSLQLGGNLSVAVGPLGRSAEASGSLNTSGRVAAMFSYSKSKGLYGGVSVEGTILVDREDANSKAYGRYRHTAKQILSGSVEVPGFAHGLISTIEKITFVPAPDRNLSDEEHLDPRRDSPADGERAESRYGYGSGYGAADLDAFHSLNLADHGGDNAPRGSDEWTDAERQRRHEAETRNMGSYAFGAPRSSMTNTPPRTGSGQSFRKRPTLRQRSSSMASNLSFGSFGRKKLDRAGAGAGAGPTPPPPSDWADKFDWERERERERGKAAAAAAAPRAAGAGDMDELDRELQSSQAARTGSASPSWSRTRSDSVTGLHAWSTFADADADVDADADTDTDLFSSTTSTATATKPSDPFADLLPSHPPAPVSVVERVVALYDFEAQEEGDLGFERGQVIAVTRRTDSRDDWWQGRVQVGSSASKVGM